MKRAGVILLVTALCFGVAMPAFASDWDKAGKILTGIEGLRVITGGKVDLIGAMFGMSNTRNQHRDFDRRRRRRDYGKKKDCRVKVWVPHYKWKRKYIPGHQRHHVKHGKIIVNGHYIKYKQETGGHWEIRDYCG